MTGFGSIPEILERPELGRPAALSTEAGCLGCSRQLKAGDPALDLISVPHVTRVSVDRLGWNI
jgi:hypothetical protein